MKNRSFYLCLLLALPMLLSALEIAPVSPRDGATVPLLNAAQKAYLAMPRAERVAFFADPEARRGLVKEAGALPLPVDFAWTTDAADGATFRVLVSESPDMADAQIVPGKNGSARIDNLKIGWTYYWQVEAATADGGTVRSAVRSFRTEPQPPRLLRFPNVPNVRDLGGRPAMNGMYVKQGLVFRSGGMNENSRVKTPRGAPKIRRKGPSRITPEGRAIFLDRYGVKSDVDLRKDSECWGMTGSPLGESVKWFHIPASSYEKMHTPKGRRAFAEVFRIFLDERNYPIVFHCISGQNRTGSLAFVLNGLLGVAEEELYLDWEVSGFWNPQVKFRHGPRFDRLIATFRMLPGENLYEQIENYVLSCGFTREDIEKFRSIMLEKR